MCFYAGNMNSFLIRRYTKTNKIICCFKIAYIYPFTINLKFCRKIFRRFKCMCCGIGNQYPSKAIGCGISSIFHSCCCTGITCIIVFFAGRKYCNCNDEYSDYLFHTMLTIAFLIPLHEAIFYTAAKWMPVLPRKERAILMKF